MMPVLTAYCRTTIERHGVRYQVVYGTDVWWELFVPFGSDKRHRAGGGAFRDAVNAQEAAFERIRHGCL